MSDLNWSNAEPALFRMPRSRPRKISAKFRFIESASSGVLACSTFVETVVVRGTLRSSLFLTRGDVILTDVDGAEAHPHYVLVRVLGISFDLFARRGE